MCVDTAGEAERPCDAPDAEGRGVAADSPDAGQSRCQIVFTASLDHVVRVSGRPCSMWKENYTGGASLASSEAAPLTRPR